MHAPDTHIHGPSVAEDIHMTHQVQQRLLHLDTQMAHLHAQVECLLADATEANGQVATLVRHVTDPHPLEAVHQRLAELAEQMEANRDQLNLLAQKLAELAGKEQLVELASTITRLSRTQFKSNALGETKEQQIERAMATLQDLVTRREQLHDQLEHRRQERFDEVRQEARAEFAAELLPALDSVELALASGQALVARQRQELAAWDQQQAGTTLPAEPQPPAAGLWQKLRLTFTGPAAPVLPTPPEPPGLPDAVTAMPDVLEAWLQGLTLVRDRFLAFLAAEGIEAMQALDTPFDPYLHVAMQAETRDDVAPHTVVRVLRQGYRQQHRVLRYAEVVVARAGAGPQPVSPAPQEAYHE
jgi:molecular chaperone GrpE (heat shock protein)